jgi:hypothetical protein
MGFSSSMSAKQLLQSAEYYYSAADLTTKCLFQIVFLVAQHDRGCSSPPVLLTQHLDMLNHELCRTHALELVYIEPVGQV